MVIQPIEIGAVAAYLFMFSHREPRLCHKLGNNRCSLWRVVVHSDACCLYRGNPVTINFLGEGRECYRSSFCVCSVDGIDSLTLNHKTM